MDIEIPVREEARIWLLDMDGSAKPLYTYLAEQDMAYDEIDDYDEVVPEQRNRQVGKADYTPYKTGGANRANK